jgi:asparagine synthase (glutamine-hydrolysing)
VPSRFKVRDGQTKWILKQAFQDRLPPGTMARAKRGFEVPMDDWLRGPLADMFENAVLAPQGRLTDLVNRAAVQKLHREHQQGVGRHGQMLWALLVLARWADRYLPSTENGSSTQPQPVALCQAR